MGFVTSQAPTLAPSLRDAPAPVLDLRRFGPIRASFCRDSDGFLWESLDLVHTQRGLADLAFEAGAWGPTAAHEQQLDTITANLDVLTESAAQAIAGALGGAFEHCLRDPWRGLEWQGARLTGRDGTFQLHYWWTSGTESLVTVSFEQSRPTSAHLNE